ncbi:hypothetical protein TSH100_04225 [Azospirillum sp. TSH100]|uniref:hypothetical protein n=1 Tax=Azospirillum sp. TSH100 TaxID=652764 RepID=UPI000D60AA1D|nr:hypothetical protein [Azospirillum sp. TSH100]PWC89849.1 hypothetical protein TSH100_04225 [Azospirillum sp. TSH100]QCG92329.1 hypothetical protein E6C72_31480 [Azospirillum sp. TSH100]
MIAALLRGLWGRIGPTLLIVGAVLAAVATFGASQRRAGRQEAAAESTQEALRAAEVRHDVEDAVRRDGPGATDRLRNRWARD